MNFDFARNPRIHALLIIAVGAASAALVLAIGALSASGRTGGKAIMLVGVGGIAIGAGLMELLWPPPPPADDRDQRNFFTRASWPQKTLYVLGGLVGLVAGAIVIASNRFGGGL